MIVDIEDIAGDFARAAHAQIGRDRIEPRGIAGEQVQPGAALGVEAGGGLGDRRGRADHEDARHEGSITRRQKPDENEGSR